MEARQVLVVVIGPGWLSAVDERGKRRIDDPDDWGRLEVGTALARGVLVIPVLVEGAVMPVRDDLPEDLGGLARRNAVRVRHESYRDDAERLVTAVERAVGAAKATRDDLARAARLVDDAEPIANSISDGSARIAALREVAEAMAVIDPGRAERIANSISNEYKKVKALGSGSPGHLSPGPPQIRA